MRYPAFLPQNGCIGYVAPSFGCATEPYRSAFDNTLRKLKALGFSADLGPNCHLAEGIGISNTPQECARELMTWYEREQNQVLISCGGGELMCETLPYMDYSRIRAAAPKWFMGFSDNTNFTFLSATLCDTAAIYGPNAASFGMEPWHPAIIEALELLCGKRSSVHSFNRWESEGLRDEEHPFAPYHCTENTLIRKFPEEDVCMEGRLLGGCLDSLCNLVGTSFDQVKEFNERYREDGVIWFLEACDLDAVGIRRAIWQLYYAGWFDSAKGFLIGRPHNYGTQAFGLDQYEAVLGILRSLKVPVLMDLDIGHVPPMMPLICGGSARVECRGNFLNISYTWR